jgi:tyrosyl-tRNA synthetase
MTKDFITIIRERGFVHQMTDENGLRDLLKTGPQTAYIGFDCTAKSLHVGSLLQIMLLRWWQKCGHRPIVLLGGGTTKIGDPSGKDESRPPLTDAQIHENMDSLKLVFSQFLSFSNNESPTPENAALMVNNDDWLKDLNYPQFLRDYGRHFSVNRMLSMDSVKLRLERQQNLSFLEFNYMIFQAYDFVKLKETYNCRVQLGGSDQWGNIINGIELNRRIKIPEYAAIPSDPECEKDIEFLKSRSALKDSAAYKNEAIFGITSPLLTTSSGAKMGKTAAGAVWLNADLLKPYDYWQFWRNTEDGDVIRFLKLFTEIPLTEIKRAEANTSAGRHWDDSLESLADKNMLDGAAINEAKIILATEATAMLHGREEAERAAKTAADTFAGSGVSDDLPTYPIQQALLSDGEFLRSYIVKAGWAVSNGDVRRLFEGGGIKLNDIKITDYHYKLTLDDFTNDIAKLSKKKDHVLIKIVYMSAVGCRL